jgi:germination protein M
MSVTNVRGTAPAYIQIDSPQRGDRVGSRFVARGSSNVFEAAMLYKLKDADGDVVRQGQIMASSGRGTPGTWKKRIGMPEDAAAGAYRLVVYNTSPKDGSVQFKDAVRVNYAPSVDG